MEKATLKKKAGTRYHLVIMIAFLVTSGIASKSEKMYEIFLQGYRGTEVIKEITPSLIICSIICSQDVSCLGYNWLTPSSSCQIIATQQNITSDSTSNIYVPVVPVGDSGYPLLSYKMTPIANPTNPQEERYNRSHMRTRVIVEQTFGGIKSRFRCLHKSGGSLQYVPEKCAKITVVCLLLHNYCVQRRIPLPADFINEDDDPDDPPQDNAAIGDNIHHGRAERLELLRTAFAH